MLQCRNMVWPSSPVSLRSGARKLLIPFWCLPAVARSFAFGEGKNYGSMILAQERSHHIVTYLPYARLVEASQALSHLLIGLELLLRGLVSYICRTPRTSEENSHPSSKNFPKHLVSMRKHVKIILHREPKGCSIPVTTKRRPYGAHDHNALLSGIWLLLVHLWIGSFTTYSGAWKEFVHEGTFLAYFPKVGLCDLHAVCMSVNPSINFLMAEAIFMKLGI
jgi:hypothetical protein